MLFAPQGLGGLVSLHARKVRADGWKHLVAPYLLCLVVGLLLIAGLVFVVESIHVVLSDAYLAKRTACQGRMGALRAVRAIVRAGLGPRPGPFPIVLLAIGGGLLPLARRITARAWLAATRDVPGEPARAVRDGRSSGRPGSAAMSAQLSQPRRAGARAQGPQEVVRRDADHPRRRSHREARPAPRADRAQRRRQVDAVQSDLGPLRADLRRDPAQRALDRRVCRRTSSTGAGCRDRSRSPTSSRA